jgi:invasion protein IalB
MKLRISAPARIVGTAFALLAASAIANAADTKPPAAAATPPAAPVSTEPQNTSATYGDWTLRCSRADAPQAPRICEIVFPFPIQGQQGLFAQLVIGRVSPKDPWKATVIMAPNIGFPSSVKLSLDDKDTQAIDLPWRFCMPGGCRADTDLKEDDLKRWKAAAGPAHLTFKDSTSHDVPMPVSLRGFAQALDGLAKS